MIDTTLDVSVVICAYTEERWYNLIAAVESIQQQTLAPCEIIVVIDHNKRLYERTRAHMTDVAVLENSELKGLSGARNSGIERTKGKLIAFLDDDAIAEPDWLERLTKCCREPDVLGVGGIVEPLWDGICPKWFPKEFYWVIGCTYQKMPGGPTIVRNPYGGCTCIRREVFEEVGGFRNGIGRIGTKPLGGEETELCIRAMKHWPRKIFLCEPRAKIYHHVPARRVSWRYFHERCYAEGLSKAIITRHAGAKDSLSSEQAYTFKILPSGVVRGIADCVLRHDPTGLQRAGAILAGLATTTIGYLMGILSWPVYVENEVNKPVIKQAVDAKTHV